MSKAKLYSSQEDIFVTYWSPDDKTWVSHSLAADQLGTGGSPESALFDARQAVSQVVRAASKDKSLVVRRPVDPTVVIPPKVLRSVYGRNMRRLLTKK